MSFIGVVVGVAVVVVLVVVVLFLVVIPIGVALSCTAWTAWYVVRSVVQVFAAGVKRGLGR